MTGRPWSASAKGEASVRVFCGEGLRPPRTRSWYGQAGGDSVGGEATKSAFAASVAAVLVGAFVLRLGGRAALVSVLGLDVVAELGIGDQIDQVLQYADQAGAWTIVAFMIAWVVAKVFLVDVISLALAFSSGVLFGGVVEGAVLSATGATIGTVITFVVHVHAAGQYHDPVLIDQPRGVRVRLTCAHVFLTAAAAAAVARRPARAQQGEAHRPGARRGPREPPRVPPEERAHRGQVLGQQRAVAREDGPARAQRHQREHLRRRRPADSGVVLQ